MVKRLAMDLSLVTQNVTTVCLHLIQVISPHDNNVPIETLILVYTFLRYKYSHLLFGRSDNK